MKTISKLLSLLLIFFLTANMAAASSHDTERMIPGNYTALDNVTIQPISHGYDAGNKPAHVANVEVHNNTFAEPVKILPSSSDIMSFAKNSDATDNQTLEEQLIAHNASWYFDTYTVKIKEIRKNGELFETAKNITVVVVYDNESSGKTNYGRVQLYASDRGICIVNPAPMYLCRPLDITAIDGSWGFKTGVVDTYKIVYSYFGVPTISIEEPVIPEKDKEIGCPVGNSSQPVTQIENNSVDNSTIITASGNQSGSRNTVENSTGTVNVQGNGNIIKQFLVDLSNFTNSTVNFVVNYGN